jgi:predicted site-specific integrase-resolvase
MDQGPKLVGTAEAARAIGVDRSTLYRWERGGRVRPEVRTMGGQARWNIEKLRAAVDQAAPVVPAVKTEGVTADVKDAG